MPDLHTIKQGSITGRVDQNGGAALPDGMDRSLRKVRRNVRDSRTGIWSARHWR